MTNKLIITNKIKQWAPVLGLAIAVAACGDDDTNKVTRDGGAEADSSVATNTITDIAAGDAQFSTLVGALQATGLDETLAGEGPFTVFAPTNAAFDLLPAGVVDGLDSATLETILTYHVVPGSVDAAAVVGLDNATTVEGSDISIFVDGSGVVLNGVVQVTTTDIQADNGIIHVIDSVLLPGAFPGDLVQAASAHPIFSTVTGAVVSAGLASTLQGDNGGDGYTLFAPINSAFDGVDLSTLTPAELGGILTYHALADTVTAETVVGLTTATTVQGSNIDIAVVDGGVQLNGSINVIRTDYLANNGVIHVIDGLLTPPVNP